MVRHTGHHRRGAILPLAAVMLGIFLTFAALAIDIGYITLVCTELQRAADAAALAGVSELPDEGRVEAIVGQYIDLNRKNPEAVSYDLEYGWWNIGQAVFTPAPAEEANAIRVTAKRTHDDGNEVSLFFGRMLDRDGVAIHKSAIAVNSQGLCGPIIGIDSVTMQGNPRTDSWDSTTGPYHSSSASDLGSICSNGPITLIGSAEVNGNANAGPGHQTTVVGSATVTGDTEPRTHSINFPSVDASEAAASNDNDSLPPLNGGNSPLDNHRNFRLPSRANYDLPGGTYYWNNFTISNNATLNVTGKVKIYLTGNIDFSGGAIAAGIPGDMKIYMVGGTVSVSGHSALNAVIYAPDSVCTITGTGDVYGAIIARTINMQGNAEVHYDERLRSDKDLNLPNRVVMVQ